MKYCQNCGTQNNDEAIICTNCGYSFEPKNTAQSNNTQVVQVNNIVPRKKKRGCLVSIIVFVIIVVFLGIAFSGGEETEKETGDIGSYNVIVKDYFVAEDYDDEKILVVTYTFTNNSETNASFDVAIYEQCFQNGVELNKNFFTDIDNYDDSNSTKSIKPGASIDVQQAYDLNDEESDIDVEISEFLGFDDPITFEIELD